MNYDPKSPVTSSESCNPNEDQIFYPDPSARRGAIAWTFISGGFAFIEACMLFWVLVLHGAVFTGFQIVGALLLITGIGLSSLFFFRRLRVRSLTVGQSAIIFRSTTSEVCLIYERLTEVRLHALVFPIYSLQLHIADNDRRFKVTNLEFSKEQIFEIFKLLAARLSPGQTVGEGILYRGAQLNLSKMQ